MPRSDSRESNRPVPRGRARGEGRPTRESGREPGRESGRDTGRDSGRAARAARGAGRGDGREGRGASRRATHSLEQILATAIAILDRDGAKSLTLRGLAGELGGGLGSIYWYVEGKDEVLSRVCDSLVGEALDRAAVGAVAPGRPAAPELTTKNPQINSAVLAVRATAMALFEQTQLHSWLAVQLQLQGAESSNALRFWDRLGRSLADMGLTARQQFHGSTAIIGYVVGVAAEMSAQDALADPTRSQAEQFEEIIAGWRAADSAEFGWIQSIAEEFRVHDDADQFAAGLDLLLSGLVQQAVAR